jgi:hypothetical protein
MKHLHKLSSDTFHDTHHTELVCCECDALGDMDDDAGDICRECLEGNYEWTDGPDRGEGEESGEVRPGPNYEPDPDLDFEYYAHGPSDDDWGAESRARFNDAGEPLGWG